MFYLSPNPLVAALVTSFQYTGDALDTNSLIEFKKADFAENTPLELRPEQQFPKDSDFSLIEKSLLGFWDLHEHTLCPFPTAQVFFKKLKSRNL